MKRHIKLISLCLTCVMLCVPLVGCDKTIRDMKKSTATTLENGNLSFNGEEYVQLPEGEYSLNIKESATQIKAVHKDVPLFLTGNYASESMFCYNNGEIISTQYSGGILEGERDNYRHYCRADLYNSLVSQIQNGVEYTTYSYDYYTLSNLKLTHTLTQEQIDAIEYVLSRVEPRTVDFEDINYDSCEWIDRYSDDEMFKDVMLSVQRLDGHYSLRVPTGNNETFKIYLVPISMTGIFDEMTKYIIDIYK